MGSPYSVAGSVREFIGKDGNGSGLDRVEQYQIYTAMKKSMGEKLCPFPNPMDIHIHWISIGSSRDI